MAMQLNLPTGFYQATMLFTGTDIPRGAAIVFGGSHGAGSPSTAATAINGAFNTHLKSVFNVAVSLAGTRVKFGPMDDGAFSYVTAGTAGTLVGAATPPNVAYLIRKNTAFGGRQGTGRIYQPGVTEPNVGVDGTVAGAHLTAMQTAWTGFLGGLNSVSLPMYLLHSYGTYVALHHGDPVSIDVDIRAPTEVTSLSVDSKVATQRRRLR